VFVVKETSSSHMDYSNNKLISKEVKTMKLALSLVMAVLIGLCFTPAWAQDDIKEGSAGLENQFLWVAAAECERIQASWGDAEWDFFQKWELSDRSDDDGKWYCRVPLPDGALIVDLKSVWFKDTDDCDDADQSVALYKVLPSCSSSPDEKLICSGSTADTTIGTNNGAYDCLDCIFKVAAPRTVKNKLAYYMAVVDFYANSQGNEPECDKEELRYLGLRVKFQRQVSNPPDTPTFKDVDTGDFGYKHIEALYASGITGGCDVDGQGNKYYCPGDPVTRAQMAVFLSAGYGLHCNNK
jgi:hypothetical protein